MRRSPVVASRDTVVVPSESGIFSVVRATLILWGIIAGGRSQWMPVPHIPNWCRDEAVISKHIPIGMRVES